MIDSQLKDEFRDAIIAKLPPGEQFLTACQCYQCSWEVSGTGQKEETLSVRWFVLALTNINLREVWWKTESKSPPITKMFYKARPRGSTSIPEVGRMRTFPISDVVSSQYESSKPRKQLLNQLRTWFPKWPHKGVEGETGSLVLTLSDGSTFETGSPFIGLSHLADRLDAAKSGALIVDNTAAAANALDQLVPLLKDGILTQEEFDRAKDGFLGATVEVRESSVGLLRQLHSLHKSGVLSESEFNLKKWDVLSKDE